jgi:SAM-dependent methyltransferase
MEKPNGIVLRSESSIYEGKVFYVDQGKRHWVRSIDWFHRNGFQWEEVVDVSPEIIYSYRNGGIAPIYTRKDLALVGNNSIDMRDILTSNLSGIGVEFGAGASPLAVPLSCQVLYCDMFSYDTLKKNMYPGQNLSDLVFPHYVSDIKNLWNVANESVDFVIACHVIEHTNNPIRALDEFHRILKPGGSLVLIVPDKTRTFDVDRELTTLDHLVEDYNHPSVERDRDHYMEFYTKTTFKVPSENNLDEFVQQKQENGGDIHYHTWTYESFQELVEWHCEKNHWTIDFCHPTLEGPENIEFYFLLLK